MTDYPIVDRLVTRLLTDGEALLWLIHDCSSSPGLLRIGLLLLCAAYLQGGIEKLVDFPGAVDEQARLGLRPAMLFAGIAIATELGGGVLVLTGWFRWLGALWLGGFTLVATCIANRFWRLTRGEARFVVTIAFFEHLGLAGGFLIVSILDLGGR